MRERVHRIATLTEELDFDGIRLEAFVTGGGVSTAPYTLKGRVRSYEYKTLRFPGHGAYMRAFRDPLPFMGIPLIGLWIVIPIVLGVRRLPYTVRGTFSSLLIVHRSFEEAAESVGATKLRTFKDVTLPLIWKGVLTGSLYSFILALQEASATLLLVVPGHEMMTVGIFNFYIGGSVNEAAALGFILIILGAACLLIINRLAGGRMGGVFG